MTKKKKPNQIQDELTGYIYPPPEAVIPQLAALKNIAVSAINVYENTEDIHSIFPNLDQLQRGIDYLRGAPAIDIPEEPEPPEDILLPGIWLPEEVDSTYNRADDGTYEYTIYGSDIQPSVLNEEMFGTLPIDTLMAQVDMQIECNHKYVITQINPVLKYFPDDPFVTESEEGDWVKSKAYMFTEDDLLEYQFLIPSGRNEITIYVDDDNGNVGTFKFLTHVHFAEKQEEVEKPPAAGGDPETPPTENPDPGEGDGNDAEEETGSSNG